MTVQTTMPCPVCKGEGLIPRKTDLYLSNLSPKQPCDGPCGGSGRVPFDPKKVTEEPQQDHSFFSYLTLMQPFDIAALQKQIANTLGLPVELLRRPDNRPYEALPERQCTDLNDYDIVVSVPNGLGKVLLQMKDDEGRDHVYVFTAEMSKHIAFLFEQAAYCLENGVRPLPSPQPFKKLGLVR